MLSSIPFLLILTSSTKNYLLVARSHFPSMAFQVFYNLFPICLSQNLTNFSILLLLLSSSVLILLLLSYHFTISIILVIIAFVIIINFYVVTICFIVLFLVEQGCGGAWRTCKSPARLRIKEIVALTKLIMR